jgi:hypothetical protein
MARFAANKLKLLSSAQSSQCDKIAPAFLTGDALRLFLNLSIEHDTW